MFCGKKYLLPVLLIAATVHLSCGGGDIAPGPGDQANDHISITNDESAIAWRFHVTDVDVPVDDTGVGYGSAMGAARPAAAPSFSLKLTAEVLPPTLDGKVLQATSIAMSNNKAVVSYNMRGAEYLGGIDVFLISNEKNVFLKSEALFNNADVNSVTYNDTHVYAAQACGDGAFPYPAVFEVLGLQGVSLILDGNGRAPLTSYAGTSAVFRGSRVYATSGDNGALSVFDPDTLAPHDSFDLHDARWVDVNDGKVVVVQGTPGRISVFDEATMVLENIFPFEGANIAESKSTVQVIGGKAIIAAGDNGVQVLSLATGNVLGHVPLPDNNVLGLPRDVVVTNAVSAEGDLLFISNGEAGVYVAQVLNTTFDQDWGDTPRTIEVLGKLRFSALQSVNHVAYKEGLLIVASGLGGLKVVRLSN
jgi:hypothetical protein